MDISRYIDANTMKSPYTPSRSLPQEGIMNSIESGTKTEEDSIPVRKLFCKPKKVVLSWSDRYDYSSEWSTESNTDDEEFTFHEDEGFPEANRDSREENLTKDQQLELVRWMYANRHLYESLPLRRGPWKAALNKYCKTRFNRTIKDPERRLEQWALERMEDDDSDPIEEENDYPLNHAQHKWMQFVRETSLERKAHIDAEKWDEDLLLKYREPKSSPERQLKFEGDSMVEIERPNRTPFTTTKKKYPVERRRFVETSEDSDEHERPGLASLVTMTKKYPVTKRIRSVDAIEEERPRKRVAVRNDEEEYDFPFEKVNQVVQLCYQAIGLVMEAVRLFSKRFPAPANTEIYMEVMRLGAGMTAQLDHLQERMREEQDKRRG